MLAERERVEAHLRSAHAWRDNAQTLGGTTPNALSTEDRNILVSHRLVTSGRARASSIPHPERGL